MATFVVFRDTAGYYRWRLVASNGQKIATSGEAFASKANAERSARLVRDYAPSAFIVDESKSRLRDLLK